MSTRMAMDDSIVTTRVRSLRGKPSQGSAAVGYRISTATRTAHPTARMPVQTIPTRSSPVVVVAEFRTRTATTMVPPTVRTIAPAIPTRLSQACAGAAHPTPIQTTMGFPTAETSAQPINLLPARMTHAPTATRTTTPHQRTPPSSPAAAAADIPRPTHLPAPSFSPWSPARSSAPSGQSGNDHEGRHTTCIPLNILYFFNIDASYIGRGTPALGYPLVPIPSTSPSRSSASCRLWLTNSTSPSRCLVSPRNNHARSIRS